MKTPFDIVIDIINTDGYITSKKLMEVYGVRNIDSTLTLIENLGEPLYKDEKRIPNNTRNSILTYKTITIYKRCKPMFEQWAAERKIDNRHPGGFIRTNQRSFV